VKPSQRALEIAELAAPDTSDFSKKLIAGQIDQFVADQRQAAMDALIKALDNALAEHNKKENDND
jgi:hypothetical protein